MKKADENRQNRGQKRGRSIPVVIGMLLLFVSITAAGQVLGDVNGSGSVDIVDALQIAQYYVGLNPSGFNVDAADADCSGTVNIVDALRVAQYYVGLVSELSCPGDTPVPGVTSPPSVTNPPSGTSPPGGELYTGNSTWFAGIGGDHYGGCGMAQADLDTQDHIALNVQRSPGDYTTFHERPISREHADQIGLFNNGLNCGRWVRVVIGDYCNGINDGAPNEPFCRDGGGWTEDEYNGAELYMIVADSCHDGNAWCRDDYYHVDLSRYSINKFIKNGQPVGDLDPDHYNNRQVHWEFVEAPNYSGDIRIGFIKDTQPYWPVVAVSHLRNGIHGVDYYDGTGWVKAKMNYDMGHTYVIGPTSTSSEGVPGTEYRIRVYDADDRLINNGRIYRFDFPANCGDTCPNPFNEVSYTVE
ncbi:MAG: dockerin type I repeat-containing protein [Spirochaetales bacterium]|nr:dockerin type I repeat-containing protein [Spirochaetales bacterium]